jgi:hypothetical protein
VTAIAHAARDPGTLGRLLAPGGRMVSAICATTDQTVGTDIDVTPVMAVPSPDKMTRLGGFHAVADGSLQDHIANTYPMGSATLALADFSQPKTGKLVVTAG